MTCYATLADVRGEIRAENTVDDAKVMRFIRQLSARIDRRFRSNRPVFAPYKEARPILIDGWAINSINRTLQVGAPVLSLSGVSLNGSSLTIGTNVQIYPEAAAPFSELQLIGDCGFSWYDWGCTGCNGSRYASIDGIWGYNANYAQAWLVVDALQANITDTQTTLTVADVDGENGYAETPRISAGHLLQIDDEWMEVVKTDALTNIVTVIRGVNGTTAAAHLEDAEVSVYLVEECVRRMVTRQAAMQYSRQGAFNTRVVQEFTATDYPPDLLQEWQNLLAMYANL